MNTKIVLTIVTLSLLACNLLLPPTASTTREPAVVIRPTEAVPEPTEAPQQSDAVSDMAVTGITLVRLHIQDGDLETMLAQEAQKAMALGQMPVVEFDATWCPPCQVIQEGLEAENELLLEAYAGTYIIKLDVDEWGWADSSLHDFEFDGIPVYFKLDEQGQPTGEVIDGGAWGDNIPENIAPPMDDFFHGD